MLHTLSVIILHGLGVGFSSLSSYPPGKFSPYPCKGGSSCEFPVCNFLFFHVFFLALLLMYFHESHWPCTACTYAFKGIGPYHTKIHLFNRSSLVASLVYLGVSIEPPLGSKDWANTSTAALSPSHQNHMAVHSCSCPVLKRLLDDGGS